VREVHLTDRGRRVVEESLALRERWAESLVRSLSADQQAALAQAMRLLNDRTESLRPPLG
jgi:DNA-binding MarR family transcriptional regulator